MAKKKTSSSTAIPPSAWQAAKVIHTRTEKVSESLTWAASRLAPPAPPPRPLPQEDALRDALEILLKSPTDSTVYRSKSGKTFLGLVQELEVSLNYNSRYLEYVALYETYLGHLRRLERVHAQLSHSSVQMPSGNPVKGGPNDSEEDSVSKPGYGLVATPFPPQAPSAKKAERLRAKRQRQRAARRARHAEKRAAVNDAVTEELSSQIRLAKAQSAWIKVERKGKRSALKKATPQVVPRSGGRPPPSSGNRKARRYAIYGVPTQTK